MKRKVIIPLALILTGALAGINLLTAKTETTITGTADYAFTATELIDTYSNQPHHSDSLYLERILLVEGTIKYVTPVSHEICVELNTGDEMETITGTVDSTAIPENLILSSGRNVILKGRCKGYTEEDMLGLKNVSLIHCSIRTR
jgi:pectate lyase